MKIISKVLLVLCFCILFMCVRGNIGNTNESNINEKVWKEGGPLELSPERGRYALMMSLVDNKSFYFSLPIARFATPDLGYKNGKYVSLFAPGVSLLIAPGYIVGKYLGISQVGAFTVITLFAAINFWLIVLISKKIGSSHSAGIISGLVFLFATPAFAYGVSLYQHHISTFLILLSIYVLLKWENLWSLTLVWLLLACSIPVDYPNLFLMFPIAMWASTRFFGLKFVAKTDLLVNVKFKGFLTLIGTIIPLVLFLGFNKASYGNPFQLSGTVASVQEIGSNGLPTPPKTLVLENVESYVNPDTQKKTAVHFFKTRNMLNGFYTHLLSPDRGILYFTPVIFLGVLGMYFLYKKNSILGMVLSSVVLINLVLYSMWGDPWGGWAFGSRYMIPSYAVLSILLSSVLTRFKRNIWLVTIFLCLAFYSVGVNTLGAITSNTNPPQIEILALEKQTGVEEKYTYMRNWNLLKNGQIKTFVYQSYLENIIQPVKFYWIIVLLLCFSMSWFVSFFYFSKYDSKN